MKTLEQCPHPWWDEPPHKFHEKVVKRQCCSPENEQVFNYAKEFPQLPRWEGTTGWQKLPWQKAGYARLGKPEWDPRKFPSIIFPTVDELGVCENYVSGECDYNTFMSRKNHVRRLAETIAPAYTIETSCIPGDLVYYCGQLYECISAHPGGIWDKSHFMVTTIDNELKGKATHEELSSALSSSLSSYATFTDVSSIVSSSLQDYTTYDDA